MAIVPEASCSASIVATTAPATARASGTKLKILLKSARGSNDPTKAALPFLHGDALYDAGHEVQIFLLGAAVSLLRKSVHSSIVPVGWRQRSEGLSKILPTMIVLYA